VDFYDSGNAVDYCVLTGAVDADLDGTWDNGFLLFVTPRFRVDMHRRVHFTAPHIVTDAHTQRSVRVVHGGVWGMEGACV
jgi:hypothetical protein